MAGVDAPEPAADGALEIYPSFEISEPGTGAMFQSAGFVLEMAAILRSTPRRTIADPVNAFCIARTCVLQNQPIKKEMAMSARVEGI